MKYVSHIFSLFHAKIKYIFYNLHSHKLYIKYSALNMINLEGKIYTVGVFLVKPFRSLLKTPTVHKPW